MGPGGLPRLLASCACRGPRASPVQAGTEDRPSPVAGGEVRTWTGRQEPGHCSPLRMGGLRRPVWATPWALRGHLGSWVGTKRSGLRWGRPWRECTPSSPPGAHTGCSLARGRGLGTEGEGRVGPSWERRHPPIRLQCLPACPGLPACPPHPAMEHSPGNGSTTRRDEPGQGGPGGHGLAARAPCCQSTSRAPPRLGAGSWEVLGPSVAVGTGRLSALLLDTVSTPG